VKHQSSFLDFFLREWLLVAAVAGLAVTSIYLKNLPRFSTEEVQVVFILAALFVTVRGLQRSGAVLRLSQNLEKGGLIPLKLVVATFFLSMVVTNDIALVVVVPLTLLLRTERRDIIVILEALAANAGSALTPFGNPQNLFIYWFYGVEPVAFVSSIAPFSIAFLAVLALVSLLVRTSGHMGERMGAVEVRYTALVYGVILVVLVLTVLHVLPVFAGVIALLYAAVFDRESLKVDYAMLITFFCFFGLAENMKVIFSSRVEHSGHIFIFSALASQIISNVPATLLLAKFTTQWKALLWGSNVGGFGSLVGSFANLIAYRLYVTHGSTDNLASFTVKFLVLGYVAFLFGIGLYFIAG